MKRLLAIAAAATLSLAIAIGGATAASADPYDCETVYTSPGDGAGAKCTNGTGEYRAVVTCNRTWPRSDFTAYGKWVRVENWSVAFCGHEGAAKNKGLQVR